MTAPRYSYFTPDSRFPQKIEGGMDVAISRRNGRDNGGKEEGYFFFRNPKL